MKTNKRNACFDFLKLFASVIVVVYHCLNSFSGLWGNNYLSNIIWFLQISIFMFVSGFLSKKTDDIVDFASFFKRFVRSFLVYLVPCFTFSILKTIFLNENSGNLFLSILYLFLDPTTSLWYLFALFLITAINDLSCLIINKSNIINIKKAKEPIRIVLLSLLNVGFLILYYFLIRKLQYSNIFCIRLISFYMPVFIIGIVVKKMLDNPFFTINFRITLLFLSLSIFVFCVFGYGKFVNDFDDNSFIDVAIRLVGGITGSIALFLLLSGITNKVFVFISSLGRFSLELYYFHLLLIGFISHLCKELIGDSVIGFLICLFFVLIISTILILVSILFPFFHILLFGKKKETYYFSDKKIYLFNKRLFDITLSFFALAIGGLFILIYLFFYHLIVFKKIPVFKQVTLLENRFFVFLPKSISYADKRYSALSKRLVFFPSLVFVLIGSNSFTGISLDNSLNNMKKKYPKSWFSYKKEFENKGSILNDREEIEYYESKMSALNEIRLFLNLL